MLEILRLVQDLIKYIQENIVIFAVHINPENNGVFSLFLCTLLNTSAARHIVAFHY